MAGMIGASARGGQYDPSQLSGSDKMMMLGAMLRDTGNSLRGGDSDAVLQTRNMLAGRQMYQNSLNMIRGLMGGQPSYQAGPDPSVAAPSLADATNPGAAPAPTSLDDLSGALSQSSASMAPAPPAAAQPYVYQPPTQVPGTGPLASIADPRAAQLALAGPMMGLDPKPLIDVLKANQPQFDTARPGTQVINKLTGALGAKVANPEYINGQLVDPTAPGAPGFVPNYSPMTMPDGKGGVIPLPGAEAAAQQAAQAEATGKSMGTFQTVPNLDGSSSLMLGKDVPQIGAGPAPAAGGAAGPTSNMPQVGQVPPPAAAAAGPAAGRVGTSQSPADAEYQKNIAGAAAAHYQALQAAGSAAPSSIARLQAMRGLLDGWQGGKYSPQMVDIASGMNSLGLGKMDPKMQNAQAAQALQAQMTMELMKNPDTGANMFPRVTNFEMQQFTKAVPGLMQSPGSRDKLIDMYSAVQQRAADVASMARQWNQQYGRIDAPDRAGQAFQDRLNTWSQQHPLFAGIPGAQGLLKQAAP